MGTQRALQNAIAPGIAPAHTLAGTPVQGVGGITHSQGAVQPAGLHSTAPYKPPKRRVKDNLDKPLCESEGCKAYPMKQLSYCSGHARKLGLIENWSTKKKETADGDAGGSQATDQAADGDDGGGAPERDD